MAPSACGQAAPEAAEAQQTVTPEIHDGAPPVEGSPMATPSLPPERPGPGAAEAAPAAMGLSKPPVQYVDGAYIPAQKLVEAAAAGRELIGPAPPPAQRNLLI
jgi:hypothetical protein